MLDDLASKLGAFGDVVARLARELVARARNLTEQINAREADLRALVRRLAPPLLAVPGCATLGAATIPGETAGTYLFRSKDAYTGFTGTASTPSGAVTPAARCGSTVAAIALPTPTYT